MSMYPSLEDMKVHQMAMAQAAQQPAHAQVAQEALPYPINPTSAPAPEGKYSSMYPALDDYMGFSLSNHIPEERGTTAVAVPQAQTIAVPTPAGSGMMIAPLSGGSVGLRRAEVSHGIREVVLCKDGKGKVGMRVQSINKGVFVVIVQSNSPAALAGLRFGDQILMINEVIVAGFTMDKVHDLLKKADPKRILLAVRDRPFERTITMHKDSVGSVGFIFKNGKITSLVKDSSAARNGLLIDHYLLEVNGQNVVGLKDKQTHHIIDQGGNILTLTIMPAFIYDHMMKHMASSLTKKLMDHSIPDL